jgi:hypothetical protein
MSPQTFFCPSCGSHHTPDNAASDNVIRCKCGNSFVAAPIFVVSAISAENTVVPGWLSFIFIALIAGCCGSTVWLLIRHLLPQSPVDPDAKIPTLVDPQPDWRIRNPGATKALHSSWVGPSLSPPSTSGRSLVAVETVANEADVDAGRRAREWIEPQTTPRSIVASSKP